jgi:hypothetical protein
LVGSIDIRVTRGGITETLTVPVNLTSTFVPGVGFDPPYVNINDNNFAQTVAVIGASAGNISVSYAIPANLAGVITIEWAEDVPEVSITATRPFGPLASGSFNIYVTRQGVEESFAVNVNLTNTVELDPQTVAITDAELEQVVTVIGTATGPIDIAVVGILPVGVSVTHNAALGLVNIAATRPTTDIAPITGSFEIEVTRQGVTERLPVGVNLTTTWTQPPPTLEFNPVITAITNDNLVQIVEVEGTATGPIGINYDPDDVPTGVTISHDAATITITGERPDTNVAPTVGSFEIEVSRGGASISFMVLVNLTTTWTPAPTIVFSPITARINNAILSQVVAIEGTALGGISISYNPADIPAGIGIELDADAGIIIITGERPEGIGIFALTPQSFDIEISRGGITEILTVEVDFATQLPTDLSGIIATHTGGGALGGEPETGFTIADVPSSAESVEVTLDNLGARTAATNPIMLTFVGDASAERIATATVAISQAWRTDATITITAIRQDETVLPHDTPDAGIDFEAEYLVGLVANAEYTVAGEARTADDEGSIPIETAWLGVNVAIIRNASAGFGNSAPQNLNIPARPSAPTGLGTTNSAAAQNTGTITGVTNLMEFRAITDPITEIWTSITTAPTITGLSAGSYELRLRFVAGAAFTGAIATVTVNSDDPPHDTPDAGIDFEAERLVGLVANAAYMVAGEARTADDEGTIPIETAWLGVNVAIIRNASAGFGNSAPQNLNIPARPSAPTGLGTTNTAVAQATGTITGVTNLMEFREITDPVTEAWTSVTTEPTITGLSAGSYELRLRFVADTAFTGAIATVTVNSDDPTVRPPRLASLSISQGTLSPTFSANTFSYAVSVGNAVTSISVTATAAAGSTIVSGTGAHSLSIGANTINVVVSAPGASNITYTIVVTRAAAQQPGPGPVAPTLTLSPNPAPFITARLGANATATVNIGGWASGAITFTNDNTPDWVILTPNAAANTITVSLGEDAPATAVNDTWTVRVNRGGQNVQLTVRVNIPAAPAIATYKLAFEDQIIPREDWPANPFADVFAADWFYETVLFAYAHGIMTGTAPMTFSPDMTLTRAMAVQVLYNLEGRPGVAGLTNPFTDVAETAWYRDAVVWAADNGIVSGIGDNLFAPSSDIIRSHMTIILNNYATFRGLTLPELRDNPVFIDGDDIRDYARDSIFSMFRAGIVSGMGDNNFAPAGNATRAQFATMFKNFMMAAEIHE